MPTIKRPENLLNDRSTDRDSGMCPSRRHRPIATRECVPLGAIDRWRLGNVSLSILAVCANSRASTRASTRFDAIFDDSTDDGAARRATTTTTTTTTTTGSIRAARVACRDARDAYHRCADAAATTDSESDSAATATATATCRRAREAYERACPRSWVTHFESARAEEAKLRAVLDKGAGTRDA